MPLAGGLGALLRQAAGHHSAGRLSAAARLYDEILAVSPDRPSVLHLRGLIACQTGDRAQAIALIGRAIALDEAVAEFHNSLGVALREDGSYAEAAGSFRRALSLRADYPEALVNLGSVQYADGLADDAVGSFRAALRLRRDCAEALAALGCIAFERRSFAEAERHLRSAARASPEFAFGDVCFVGEEFARRADPARLDELLASAPPVRGDMPRSDGAGFVVATACDPAYFRRFATTLAKSLDGNAPGHDFHLHMMNPDPSFRSHVRDLRAGLGRTNLTVSWEAFPQGDRHYYSNMRFVRLYQLSAAARRDILSLDADSLVLGDIDAIDEAVGSGDISVLTRFHRPEINQKVFATTVHVRQTPLARTFLEHMAAYILTCLLEDRLVWSLDQCAFYIVCRMMAFSGSEIALVPLPARFADHDFDAASPIWAAKGSRESDPAFEAEVAKYA